ncbi:hypothetical protein D6777_02425 [Candidatus Woesearchaeota archaeon]|nr:MAG: hypothetical protein D6777_02425 [Candidatus Woesearchaeota archaeon]
MLLNAVGYRDRAKKVIKSINNIGLVIDGGLVRRRLKQGSFDPVANIIYSSDNAYWGLLLNAVGKKFRAIKVIKSMKKIGLLRDDGLVSYDVMKNGPVLSSNIYSYNNALWGMLLNAVGKKRKAIKVIKSMKNIGLVRRDGLVDSSKNPNHLYGDMRLYSYNNALWGLCLHPEGYKVFTGETE